MNEGAKVLDAGVPFRESLRLCRVTLPEGTNAVATEFWDRVRLWDGGVDAPEKGNVEGKTVDLGLPALGLLAVAGETDDALAKGLLRRCAVPWALSDMAKRRHQQTSMPLSGRLGLAQVQVGVNNDL